MWSNCLIVTRLNRHTVKILCFGPAPPFPLLPLSGKESMLSLAVIAPFSWCGPFLPPSSLLGVRPLTGMAGSDEFDRITIVVDTGLFSFHLLIPPLSLLFPSLFPPSSPLAPCLSITAMLIDNC